MSEILKSLLENSPLVMGIVNVTPDSFSDGGHYHEAKDAIAHAKLLHDQGAHILDVGGESTRPNAQIISPGEEMQRVLPVIAGAKSFASCISIDTRNAATMAAAIDAGAHIINDVSALSHDPESVHVAAQYGVPVCLMHMRGTPQTMQDNPFYEDVVEDIIRYFEERIAFCSKNGMKDNQIILDVGIGFGKTLEHNLALLANLTRIKALGFPVLLGVSRKSFIAKLSDDAHADQRLGGSLAAALWGIDHGADILRVHDVAQTLQAVQIYNAIKGAS